MPGTIRTSPKRASLSCISEKISPLLTNRKGSGNRNAAARNTSTAMFTHVTHPKARRYSGRSAPCSVSSAGCSQRSGSLPASLWDTILRGLLDFGSVQILCTRIHCRSLDAEPEVIEQGRDDIGEPARGWDAAGEHEDVGVAGVERSVVALLVECTGDLTEG